MAFGVSEAQIAEKLAEQLEMDPDELEQQQAEEEQGISDGHLVEYAEACVKEARDHNTDRDKLDEMLWDAHKSIMKEQGEKEAWQTKITTNETFTTCFQAKSLVRKAVADKPDFFTVIPEDDGDDMATKKSEFWTDALKFWAKRAHFDSLYPDMTEMAFAIGLSLGMKPKWHMRPDGPDELELTRIEPWNLYGDPDTPPRDNQGGLYLVHQDWIDYHKLLQAEEDGLFTHVRDIGKEVEAKNFGRSRKEAKRRESSLINRHPFRKSVQVTECWGDILDHNGELVMSDVYYTVANKTVIQRPKANPFPGLRWPIHRFAAIPHLTEFHGMSLIEGVLKLWKLRNNLLCMATDNANYSLNQAYECDPSLLLNPSDTEIYPGALKMRKSNTHGKGPAYVPIQILDKMQEMAPLWELTGNALQNGSFVTDLIRGTFDEGSAKQVTATEQKIKYSQGVGVFESIGKDVEFGGVEALELIQKFLLVAWSPEDHPTFAPLMRKHPEVTQLILSVSPEERIKQLALDATIEIRGVSLMLEKNDLLARYKDLVTISDSPRFLHMVKDDEIIQRIADLMDITEAVKTDEEMRQEAEALREETAAITAETAMAHEELLGAGVPPNPPPGIPPRSQNGAAPPPPAHPQPHPQQEAVPV